MVVLITLVFSHLLQEDIILKMQHKYTIDFLGKCRNTNIYTHASYRIFFKLKMLESRKYIAAAVR